MRRPLLLAALLLVAALAVLGLKGGPGRLTAPTEGLPEALAAAPDAPSRGALQFAYGDWGALSSDTLRTSGQPWKLANAALALRAAGGGDVREVDLAALYRSWGFLSPETLANWPAGLAAPASDRPLGLNAGLAARAVPPLAVTVGNIGCAACHSGVTYDAAGTPDPTSVWLGSPNTSINLEAWTQGLFLALRDETADPDRLMAAVEALYPETGLRERLTLRHVILPALRSEILARQDALGALLPYRASLSGATNGFDSLRGRLGLLPEGHLVTESVFNSVPDLGGRAWRRSLLNSASYVVTGADATAPSDGPGDLSGLARIVTYFTVPAMGVTEGVAEAHFGEAEDVLAWIAAYEPPPFPGAVDTEAAARGHALFDAGCASCHGTYDEAGRLTRFPNWIGDVGTDPSRLDLLTPDVLDTIRASYGDHMDVRGTDGYAAPPLLGLWASAPYLHNGAVPTLWHLLTPAERPARFDVGGHRLDLADIGIDLDPPADYAPWATPAMLDTAAFGLGNAGHEFGAELTEPEKRDLLAYLSTL